MDLNGLMVFRFLVSLVRFSDKRSPISVAVAECVVTTLFSDVIRKGTQKIP